MFRGEFLNCYFIWALIGSILEACLCCCRAEIEAELKSAAERASNEILDKQIKEAILESSKADVEKVPYSFFVALTFWGPFGGYKFPPN